MNQRTQNQSNVQYVDFVIELYKTLTSVFVGKKRDKNNEFKNYVTVMMEWLHRNPNNDKPIERVEKQQREIFQHKPWNKKKNVK